MNAILSDHMYIGNERYWIWFNNGTHHVRKDGGVDDLGREIENITCFTGSYEECYNWLINEKNEYLESLF